MKMLKRPVKPTMAKNYLSSTLAENKTKDSFNAVKLRSRLILRRVMSLRKEV